MHAIGGGGGVIETRCRLTHTYVWPLAGVETHPYLRTSSLAEADIVFCLAPALSCPSTKAPIALLDYTDRPTLPAHAEGWTAYFKRSYTYRAAGVSLHYPDFTTSPDVHPLPLSALESYFPLPHTLNSFLALPFLVSCTLRPSSSTRLSTLQVVDTFVSTSGIDASRTFLGQVNDGNRKFISERYAELLSKSAVIVTANPPNWEGDHRTWEALASGALVFVDRTTPTAHAGGLIDGVNCVLYDAGKGGEEYLLAKLRYYLGRGEIGLREAYDIGRRGREAVERFHRPANRMEDVVVRTLGLG